MIGEKMRHIGQVVIDSVGVEKLMVASGIGAAAQLAALYDVTLGAILQMPFFILTYATALNWLTGGATAVFQGGFSSMKFLKAPARWLGYVLASSLIAQGGLLFQTVTQAGTSPAAGIITTLYVIGFLKEGESVISNLGGGDAVSTAWRTMSEKFGRGSPE
jgi:hypothetical protein